MTTTATWTCPSWCSVDLCGVHRDGGEHVGPLFFVKGFDNQDVVHVERRRYMSDEGKALDDTMVLRIDSTHVSGSIADLTPAQAQDLALRMMVALQDFAAVKR